MRSSKLRLVLLIEQQLFADNLEGQLMEASVLDVVKKMCQTSKAGDSEVLSVSNREVDLLENAEVE